MVARRRMVRSRRTSKRRTSKRNMSKRKTRGKRYKQHGGYIGKSEQIKKILFEYGEDLPFGHAMKRNVMANRILNEIEAREGRQLNGAETEKEVSLIYAEIERMVSQGIVRHEHDDYELIYIP